MADIFDFIWISIVYGFLFKLLPEKHYKSFVCLLAEYSKGKRELNVNFLSTAFIRLLQKQSFFFFTI